jgi:hypothetical protein
VTSYLQRCAYQPVTTYQQAFYYEPVTTCCQTTVGAPIFGAPPTGAGPPHVADPGAAPAGGPPNVSDGTDQPGSETRLNRYPPPAAPVMPRVDESRQPQLKGPLTLPAASPSQPPPQVHIDRIAALPGPNLEGQVVASRDRAPHAGARVLFVSADRQGPQQSVTADSDGRFQTSLAAGSWLVYVRNTDGDPVFADKVEVKEEETRRMTLVSRSN